MPLLRNVNTTRAGYGVMYPRYAGILGSAIPATGEAGPSIIYPQLQLPADAGDYFAYWVEDPGTFPDGFYPLADDGTGTRGPYADAAYSSTVALYCNDERLFAFAVDMGVGTITAPAFTTQPSSTEVVEGSSVTLTAAYTGTTPIAAQWRRNGVDIVGATSASYTFTATDADSGAVFTLRISNIAGAAVSASAVLTVTAAPPPTDMALEDALDRVLPYAAGCPSLTAIHHIRQAAIEFFQKTLAWKQWMTAVDTVSGQDAYTFPVPAGSSIAKILDYKFDGREAKVVDGALGNSLVINQNGTDAAWTEDRYSFLVTPTPTQDDIEMQFYVALKPSQAATTLPAVMWEQYIDRICWGALARVLALPNQPFTDQAEAARYRAMFEAAINSTSGTVARSTSRSTQRVKAFLC